MSSKFTVIGSETKITFEWTALTSKIQSIVGDCAEYLFDHGYGVDGKVFSDLTNVQKLALVEAHLKDVIVNASNTFKSIKAQDAAREAEEAVKYEL
jgi:hypothetical protein